MNTLPFLVAFGIEFSHADGRKFRGILDHAEGVFQTVGERDTNVTLDFVTDDPNAPMKLGEIVSGGGVRYRVRSVPTLQDEGDFSRCYLTRL